MNNKIIYGIIAVVIFGGLITATYGLSTSKLTFEADFIEFLAFEEAFPGNAVSMIIENDEGEGEYSIKTTNLQQDESFRFVMDSNGATISFQQPGPLPTAVVEIFRPDNFHITGTLTVDDVMKLDDRSTPPVCMPGTIYFDGDDRTFCFCEGIPNFTPGTWRALDGTSSPPACTAP